MQDFNSSETLELKTLIQIFETSKHINVIAERERRMQSSHDVKFRDADMQGFPRHGHDLIGGVLKSVRIALLASKRAKLAAQDAVVGIIDVAINDVGRPVSVFPLICEIGDRAKSIEVFALEKPDRVLF